MLLFQRVFGFSCVLVVAGSVTRFATLDHPTDPVSDRIYSRPLNQLSSVGHTGELPTGLPFFLFIPRDC